MLLLLGELEGQLGGRGLAGAGLAIGPQPQPEGPLAPQGQGVADGAGLVVLAGDQGRLGRHPRQGGKLGQVLRGAGDGLGRREVSELQQRLGAGPGELRIVAGVLRTVGAGLQHMPRQGGGGRGQGMGRQLGDHQLGQGAGGAAPEIGGQIRMPPAGREQVGRRQRFDLHLRQGRCAHGQGGCERQARRSAAQPAVWRSGPRSCKGGISHEGAPKKR